MTPPGAYENSGAPVHTPLRPSPDDARSRITGHPAHPPRPLPRRLRRERRRRRTAVRRCADVRGLQALGGAAGAAVRAVRGRGRAHRPADPADGGRDGGRPRPSQRVFHRFSGQCAGHRGVLGQLREEGTRRRRLARGRAEAAVARGAEPAHPPRVRPLPAHLRASARGARRADRLGGRPGDRPAPGAEPGRRTHRPLPGPGRQHDAAGRGTPERPQDPRRPVRAGTAARVDPGPGESGRRQRGASHGRRGPSARHRHRRAAPRLRAVGRRRDAAGADPVRSPAPAGPPCPARGPRRRGRGEPRQAGRRARAQRALQAAR